MNIEAIVDREIAACFPTSKNIHPELRLFAAILVRTVVEECAKAIEHDVEGICSVAELAETIRDIAKPGDDER